MLFEVHILRGVYDWNHFNQCCKIILLACWSKNCFVRWFVLIVLDCNFTMSWCEKSTYKSVHVTLANVMVTLHQWYYFLCIILWPMQCLLSTVVFQTRWKVKVLRKPNSIIKHRWIIGRPPYNLACVKFTQCF